jgi:hypothetical protein
MRQAKEKEQKAIRLWPLLLLVGCTLKVGYFNFSCAGKKGKRYLLFVFIVTLLSVTIHQGF